MAKTVVPPKWSLRFMDWTARVTTVHKPEELDRKYDYWFAGALFGITMCVFWRLLWPVLFFTWEYLL